MVQRFVITEAIRRSFAAGRNADIIGVYTQLIPGAAATTWTGPSTTPPPEDDLRRGFGGTGTGNTTGGAPETLGKGFAEG